MAARLPSWITPDHLTLLGLAAMLCAGLFYYLGRGNAALLLMVNLCLAVNWFGDSLDGTLARYRKRQRPRYGFYVDHVIDAVGTMALLIGLGFSGFMSERLAFILLALYLLLSINSYLWAQVMGTFRLSFWKFSPTELRLLLIIGNFYLIFKPQVVLFGEYLLLYDIGGIIAAVTMAAMFIASAIQNTRRLYQLERL